MPSLQYDRLQQVLSALGISQLADEYHGALCGMLCHGDPRPESLVFDEINPNPDAQADLARFASSVVKDIDRPEFLPLLPDDDQSLDDRVQALANWCSGFLYGLGTGESLDIDRLSEEARELINDFTEISRAGLDGSGEGSEENERAYMELVEYVRVGAQLIYFELHPGQPGKFPEEPALNPTLH